MRCSKLVEHFLWVLRAAPDILRIALQRTQIAEQEGSFDSLEHSLGFHRVKFRRRASELRYHRCQNMHERRNAKCQKSGRKVTSSKKKVVLLKVEEAKGPSNRADASSGGSETIATWEPWCVFCNGGPCGLWFASTLASIESFWSNASLCDT